MLWRLRARPKYLALIFYGRPICWIRRYCACVGLNDVCILSGVRTPIGSFQGKLAGLNVIELGSIALTAAVERSGIERNEVQELVVGTAFSAGFGQSAAYHIAVSCGMSDSIIHSNINKLCASGMKAIINGCQLIATDSQEIVAAGGVDSLSNAPYFLKRRQARIGHLQLNDSVLHEAFLDPYDLVHVTSFAEKTIKQFRYTREDLDTYALESYMRAEIAQNQNAFSEEIIPISVKKKGCSEETVCHDEEVRKLDLGKIRTLKPYFGKDGTITAGNSAGLGDGAAMLILASGNYVMRRNIRPLARIISYADASLNRKHLVSAIAVAARRALLRANICLNDIQIWEIGETFPINAPLNSQLLDVDRNRVNIHGGSISLGHPIGMTSARLIIHLAHVLSPGMLGCASISHPTGGASAMIIQKY